MFFSIFRSQYPPGLRLTAGLSTNKAATALLFEKLFHAAEMNVAAGSVIDEWHQGAVVKTAEGEHCFIHNGRLVHTGVSAISRRCQHPLVHLARSAESIVGNTPVAVLDLIAHRDGHNPFTLHDRLRSELLGIQLPVCATRKFNLAATLSSQAWEVVQ